MRALQRSLIFMCIMHALAGYAFAEFYIIGATAIVSATWLWIVWGIFFGIFALTELAGIVRILYVMHFKDDEYVVRFMCKRRIFTPIKLRKLSTDMDRHLILCTIYMVLSLFLVAGMGIWAVTALATAMYLAHIGLRHYTFQRANKKWDLGFNNPR